MLSPLDLSLTLAWAALCGVWAILLVRQFTARRRGLFLEPVAEPDTPDPADRSNTTSVCIVLPARNEAGNLPAALGALLAQTHAPLTIVVVDDRSEDDTAAVAERFARSDPRLRLERITQLPPGWMGKSHALWRGTRRSDSDWFLFIDADCTLAPTAVATVLAEARRRRVDLLSLWPRQAPGGFWEHLTIPLCAAIIALWFGTRRDGSPAFANGQFLLVRRDAYERIGGHAAVRSALIEDIPLAEHAVRAGLACHVASGRNLVSVRMFEGYRAIRDGWARIYVGALRSGTKILLSLLWLLVGSLLPYAVLGALGARVASAPLRETFSDVSFGVFSGLCVLHLALMLIVSYRFWGMGGCRRRYLWLYPLSVVVVMRILARAGGWLMFRRRVAWRGRHYTIDRSGRIVV